jgi:dipeptidyl aminopeptidase/acylaminoacyl peptidase
MRSIMRTTPTLLIHGDADTQVPLRHSRRLEHASAGRAVLVVLPGASHASMPLDATHNIRARAIAWFDARLHRDQHEATSDVR